MSRRRYEILLPIKYNDGALVEPEKFFQTQEELIAAFGALTISPELLRGVWGHEGQRFEDDWRSDAVRMKPEALDMHVATGREVFAWFTGGDTVTP